MKNYNFKRRRLLSGPHLLGSLLIAAGIFVMFSPAIFKSASSFEKSLLVGLVTIILGSLIVSSYGGTLIDFNQKRVKAYFSFLGYRFGEWTTLPNIEKIIVVSVNYKASNTPNGISPTWSGTVTDYRVLLFSENSTPRLSFVFSNKERAIKEAHLLSVNLETVCEVRDV